MKISFVISIFALLLSLSFADDSKELNPFQKYIADPSITTFTQAIEFYHSDLDGDSKNDNHRIILSYLYQMEMDRMIEQIDVFADSIAPNIQFNYANLMLELRRFDKAIQVYDTLNVKYPAWSCPWRHKGEAYFKSGDLEKAEKALEQAIETRNEHYDAYVMLAEVQEAMGKNEEALKTLETGFTYLGKDIEDPEEEVEDVDVQFLYLKLLQKNGRYDKAEDIKNSLMKADPDDKRWEDIK